MNIRNLVAALIWAGLPALLLSRTTAVHVQQNRTVSFFHDIKPILRTRCQGCHQPASQGGKLILTSYQAFKAGGGSGAGFIAGNTDGSVTMRMISGPAPAMPKNNAPLTPEQVILFKQWIEQGARDDTPELKDPIDQAHPPTYAQAPVIPAMAWSPDGTFLAVAGYREVLLHHADGSGLAARLVGKAERIESLVYSPDGAVLAAAGGTPARLGEVQFWDTKTNRLMNEVPLTYDEVYGAAFSPDGKKLSVGGADNSVRIISVPDGKLLLKFDNHSDWVFATAWTMDNQHLVTTGRDQAIKLIVSDTGSFVDDINTFTSPFRTMARYPGKDNVLVAGDDGIPRLYQVFRTTARTMNQEDHDLIKAYETEPATVDCVAFSPHGTRFVAAGEWDDVRVYDTADGKRLATLKAGQPITYSAVFSPDGSEIATAGFDGVVRVFNSTTGAPLRQFVAAPLTHTVTARR